MNHGAVNLNKTWGKHHLLLKSTSAPLGRLQDPYPLYIPKVANERRLSELYTGKALQTMKALASSTDTHNGKKTVFTTHFPLK